LILVYDADFDFSLASAEGKWDESRPRVIYWAQVDTFVACFSSSYNEDPLETDFDIFVAMYNRKDSIWDKIMLANSDGIKVRFLSPRHRIVMFGFELGYG
jgi:hypothetical protein